MTNSLLDLLRYLIRAIESGKDSLNKEGVINAIKARDVEANMEDRLSGYGRRSSRKRS